MKNIQALFLSIVLLSSPLFAVEKPKGFSDPELEKLAAGEILVSNETSQGKVYKGTYKAYFDRVSCESYERLVTDHKELPKLFKDIKKAETLKSNPEKTEFEYSIKLRINEGPVTFFFEPTIAQIVRNPKDAMKEWTISNVITNYGDDIEEGKIMDRLVPYEKGILVEQTAIISLKTEDKKTSKVKDHVVSYFKKLLPAFRTALKG